MAHRRSMLDRLAVGYACRTSWEGMEGHGARRFCSECQREVLDFAQLTPREIRAQLEASRGKLCGRLTRTDGRLLTAAEPEPPVRERARRRASPVAATFVSALLSTAASEGQSSEPVAAAQAFRGQPVAGEDDAAARPLPTIAVPVSEAGGSEQVPINDPRATRLIASLPAGLHDLTGNGEPYLVESVSVTVAPPEQIETATVGIVAFESPPLRERFAQSDLVVTAVAGRSRVLERDGDNLQVATQLRVESILKGDLAGRRRISYVHWTYEATEEGELAWDEALPPGATVLAFLERSEDGSSSGLTFEGETYDAVQALEDPVRAAYVERLVALARLEDRERRQGEVDPVAIVDWIVGTAEDPFTRREGTVELFAALRALDAVAEKDAVGVEAVTQGMRDALDAIHAEGGRLREEPPPELLGALLTDGHRIRLTDAMVATRGVTQAELSLFLLVREWSERAAWRWLTQELRRRNKVADPRNEIGALADVAWQLEDEELSSLAEAAMERGIEIEEQWPEDRTPQTAELRQRALAALHHELSLQFAEVLDRRW